eukprot:1956048-Heterocapsa_arctica.AAC.1
MVRQGRRSTGRCRRWRRGGACCGRRARIGVTLRGFSRLGLFGHRVGAPAPSLLGRVRLALEDHGGLRLERAAELRARKQQVPGVRDLQLRH